MPEHELSNTQLNVAGGGVVIFCPQNRDFMGSIQF